MPHTSRSTTTSKTGQLNADIGEVLQDCCKNTKTFFNFDKKYIVYYAPEDVASLVGSSPPDKYSYEISHAFSNSLIAHFQYPSFASGHDFVYTLFWYSLPVLSW